MAGHPTYLDLLEAPAPRGIGGLLCDVDPQALKLSVEIATPSVEDPALWAAGAPGDPPGGWDISFWDNIDAGQWIDLSDRTRGIEWSRGSVNAVTPPEVGTATLTLENHDGQLSPWATTGAFLETDPAAPIWDVSLWDDNVLTSNTSWVRPGTLVRFGVTDSTSTYRHFFTGTIETITEDTELAADAWITFGLVETLASLAMFNGLQQSPAGSGDTMAQRIARLLSDAGWDYGSTVGASGVAGATLQETTMAQNRLADLKLTAASTFTQIIAGTDGKLVVTTEGTTGPDTGIVFANKPVTGDGSFPVESLTPYSSTDRIINRVVAGIVGSTQRSNDDFDSQNKFGVLTNAGGWPRTDLILTDNTLLDLLLRAVLTAHSADFFGVESVQLDADMAPTIAYGFLASIAAQALELRNQFTVRWQHPMGDVLTLHARITGFTHSLSMQGGRAKWTATLRLASV